MYPSYDQIPIATEHMLRERLKANLAFVDPMPRRRQQWGPVLLALSIVRLAVF